ncbi:hypothetical protein CASFOL_022746, partial [Castilleja foliolosa]
MSAVKDRIWLFEQEQALGFSNVSTNIRMTVIKLKSGGLWVHAPIAPTKECIQVGATGKVLENVVAVGIGGSFLDKEASEFAKARQLHFLANVDLIDVVWNIAGLNPETTLINKLLGSCSLEINSSTYILASMPSFTQLVQGGDCQMWH